MPRGKCEGESVSLHYYRTPPLYTYPSRPACWRWAIQGREKYMIDDQQDITQLRQTLQQAQEKVQILRAELYRLRRQPLPPSQPEASIQAGQDDERTRIQEALDLSHRTAQIYEAELHRMRTRSSRENSAPVTTDQQRGCLLTGWLTFSIISSICYFVLL